MAFPQPTHVLAGAVARLAGTFGERMRFSRDGSVAQWSYDGHAALVELAGADRITARFVAPPAPDAISGQPAMPVYAREGGGYPLTRAGCERMVDDMLEFFSGVREPRFTFVSTR